MHPCFLLTPRSAICENHGRCATGTDEGVRPYTSNFPLWESSLKKSAGSQKYFLADAIQDWVSSFFAEELPGRDFASMRPPVLLRRVSGARPLTSAGPSLRAYIALRGDLMLAVRTTSLQRVFSALIIVSCIPAQLTGQDSATGSLRGTVLDPTGARVPQASIVVVNTGTGAQYTATSSSDGHFALELLPPGDYSARVEAQGMSPQLTPPLQVDIGEPRNSYSVLRSPALRKV
jgi:hypothetical protein